MSSPRLNLELASHALRRLTFGPFPGEAEVAVDTHRTLEDLVDDLLERRRPFEPRILIVEDRDDGFELVDEGPLDITGPDFDNLRMFHAHRVWWIDRMLQDQGTALDKLMWIWHGIFATSSAPRGDVKPHLRQLRMLHDHALGNARDLAFALTTSGSMLAYLDGNNSNVTVGVNENHGRELMELHLLGIDQYTQDDVVAAANALAGWQIEDDGDISFHPDRALVEPVTLLGVAGVRRVDDAIDAILAHDACAPYLVGRLWDSLIGGPRDDARIGRWAQTLRSADYEILPLVRAMCHSDAFAESRGSRAKTGIEWYCAAVRALGSEGRAGYVQDLGQLGQLPYLPPSVAGWPSDDAWLSATHLRARLQVLGRLPVLAVEALAGEGAASAALRRCSIYDPSPETVAAMDALAARLDADPATTDEQRATALLTTACMSPEFTFA